MSGLVRSAVRWCAVVALVLAVAGCSSDDDGAASTTTRRRVPASTTSTTAPPASALVDAACEGRLAARRGPVVDEEIDEASGVVSGGPRDTSITWVQNDSGDAPRLFGIRPDGTAQIVAVTNAENADWEDLAPAFGPGTSGLWIADTGGNVSPRDTVQIYFVGEPLHDETTAAARHIEVRYPDGPHDVEALLSDPDGPLYLLTKEAGDTSTIYEVADPQAALGDGSVTAERVGTFAGPGRSALITGGDIAVDRSAIVLRTYAGVWLYRLGAGQSVADALGAEPCKGAPSTEVQGEAVGFLLDGSGYVTIAESALTEQPARLTTVTAG